MDKVEESGQGALILIDEFLMWAHDAASPDPIGESKDRGPFWFERLKNFFQRLSQAVEVLPVLLPRGFPAGHGPG